MRSPITSLPWVLHAIVAARETTVSRAPQAHPCVAKSALTTFAKERNAAHSSALEVLLAACSHAGIRSGPKARVSGNGADCAAADAGARRTWRSRAKRPR